MDPSTSEFLSLYKFPAGRCVFATRTVAQRARAVGASEIAALAERATDTAQRALLLQRQFSGRTQAVYGASSTAKDLRVDRGVGAVDSYLDVQERMYPDHPRGQSAAVLRKALLPRGVAAITSLPYAEEHETVSSLLAQAASPELAPHVAMFAELPELLQRLREFNDEYGVALREDSELPASHEVQAALSEARELLCELTCFILGWYAWTQGDREQRNHLLAPIAQQNQAIRASRRRRQSDTDIDPDIDPDTGLDVADGEDTVESPVLDVAGDSMVA